MQLYIESSQAEFDSHLYNTHLYNTHLSDSSILSSAAGSRQLHVPAYYLRAVKDCQWLAMYL